MTNRPSSECERARSVDKTDDGWSRRVKIAKQQADEEHGEKLSRWKCLRCCGRCAFGGRRRSDEAIQVVLAHFHVWLIRKRHVSSYGVKRNDRPNSPHCWMCRSMDFDNQSVGFNIQYLIVTIIR